MTFGQLIPMRKPPIPKAKQWRLIVQIRTLTDSNFNSHQATQLSSNGFCWRSRMQQARPAALQHRLTASVRLYYPALSLSIRDTIASVFHPFLIRIPINQPHKLAAGVTRAAAIGLSTTSLPTPALPDNFSTRSPHPVPPSNQTNVSQQRQSTQHQQHCHSSTNPLLRHWMRFHAFSYSVSSLPYTRLS